MNYDNATCVLCTAGDHEDVLILCDGCDRGFHTYCINIPAIPIGDWFCPSCRRLQVQKPILTSSKEEDQSPPGVLRPNLNTHLYERVSSKGQDAPEYGRVGLDTQNISLLDFALSNGLIVSSTVREVHSARDPSKLKQLESLVTSLKEGDLIAVYSVSRFGRNLVQSHQMVNQIHTKGCWIYSVSEKVSSFDPEFLDLLKEAQAESDRQSQKIRDAYARIRLQGGHIGPAPFGFMAYHDQAGIRRLQVNPSEQKVLNIANQLYSQHKRFNVVADELNESGFMRRGKWWSPQTVKKALWGLETFAKDLTSSLPQI